MSHALCLSVLAIWYAFNRLEMAAGILVAVATALKPQIGGAFILYFLLVRRWRASVLAMALLGVLTAVAVGRLTAAHVAWLGALQANLHAASTGGGYIDPSAANPWRWHMVNLQHPLHTFLDSRAAVGALTWLITAALFLAYVRALLAASPDRPEMLAAGIPGILCLLPVYHRYYDAVIMVIPLAWAVSVLPITPPPKIPPLPRGSVIRVLVLPITWARSFLRQGGRGSGWALLAMLCTAPFYVSWSWAFDHWIETGLLPAAWAQTWWWDSLVMPCQTWALLVLLGSLFGGLAAYRAALPVEERYPAAPVRRTAG
jgi:hypothetical protein